MPGLPAQRLEKALALTPDEAFALLEMCTLTLANESPEHLRVLYRLGSLCREMLTLPSKKEQIGNEQIRNEAVRNEQVPVDDCSLLLSSGRPRELLTIACLY